MQDITPEALTAEAFAPFGDVLEASGDFRLINDGLCRRHHDRARLDFGPEVAGGRGGISLFDATPRQLPYEFHLIERHPEGSQAFVPLSEQPFLVIVAADLQQLPRAFVTNGRQAINLYRACWHGVLTPLAAPGLFAVIDRIGPTANIEEYRSATGWRVLAG